MKTYDNPKPKPLPLEKKIEAACVKYAKDKGWLCLKMTSPSCRGLPDRLFIRGGYYLWVEFKRPYSKLRQIQRRRVDALLGEGCDVVALDFNDSDKAIAKFKKRLDEIDEFVW